MYRRVVVEIQLCYEMDPDTFPLLRVDGKAADTPSDAFPELDEAELTVLQGSLCEIIREVAPHIAKSLTAHVVDNPTPEDATRFEAESSRKGR